MKSWYKIAQNDLSQDQKYLEAIKNNDLATAQEMVDADLNAKGYTIGPVYHGSPSQLPNH